MQIFEPDHVQLIRTKHITALQDDPFKVLDINPIVGNLLYPGSYIHVQPDHSQNRFHRSETFVSLYNRRARVLADVMTQAEVQESVQWDDCSRPSPKSSWIRFER